MLQEKQKQEQERKLSGPKPSDGHKLSFAEKMKLFAQEVRYLIKLVDYI